jgi:hypothetical protein
MLTSSCVRRRCVRASCKLAMHTLARRFRTPIDSIPAFFVRKLERACTPQILPKKGLPFTNLTTCGTPTAMDQVNRIRERNCGVYCPTHALRNEAATINREYCPDGRQTFPNPKNALGTELRLFNNYVGFASRYPGMASSTTSSAL